MGAVVGEGVARIRGFMGVKQLLEFDSRQNAVYILQTVLLELLSLGLDLLIVAGHD